jgi:hypothetical protein
MFLYEQWYVKLLMGFKYITPTTYMAIDILIFKKKTNGSS